MEDNMNDDQMGQAEGTCMACSCPCAEHKEHNHDTTGMNLCEKCNHEHKEDGTCPCGCN